MEASLEIILAPGEISKIPREEKIIKGDEV